MKYLNIPFEHWKICEWAVKSIQAYKDIHFTNETFENDLTREELIEYLTNKGISANYNEPMSKEQVSRLKENELRTIYNNIQITHNLVNIQQAKGGDLQIQDTDKYIYLMTYSFPCQDLSLAGKRKGMADTSTRSGMLWEVERILNECENKPQLLLMENVPQVHSEENKSDFIKWIKALEEMGYTNYWQDLIATDYGIPQTRNRCFMVSILGDYNYSFPEPIPLKLRLKDLLEDNVPEKYYLSDKMIKFICSDNDKYLGNNDKSLINKDIASTIRTGGGNHRCDSSNYISNDVGKNFNLKDIIPNHTKVACELDLPTTEINNRVFDTDYAAPSLTAVQGGYQEKKILIKNATKQGFLEAEEGDGVDISSRMEYHRGTVQKGKAQTILTGQVRG